MPVQLIQGNSFTDHRGSLRFVNDFTFTGVKRFYQIEQADTTVIRAWQGHKIEHKYFYVARGTFAIAWVEIDNWETPSAALKAEHVLLRAAEPVVLSIPAGFANGIKAMEPDSLLMVYSNLTLEQSAEDRWSFEAQRWFNWQQLS